MRHGITPEIDAVSILAMMATVAVALTARNHDLEGSAEKRQSVRFSQIEQPTQQRGNASVDLFGCCPVDTNGGIVGACRCGGAMSPCETGTSPLL